MSIPTTAETINMSQIRHENGHVDSIRNTFDFKTLRGTKQILYYEDGIYKTGGETIIEEECEKIIPDCSTYKCKEVVNTIRRQTYLQQNEEFDNYGSFINLKNGILNLTTGKLQEHSPKFFFRIQIPVSFDPNTTCKKFEKFMHQCIPDEKNRTKALESFASILLPNFKLDKMFMNVGSGSNGKSTFLEIIEKFLGSDNVSNISIHDMESDKFATSGLDSKLANIYADISRKELPELGSIKALISGDPIEVQRKGQQRFKMRNTAKLIFSCNELPELGEDSHAVFRRIVLIEWNQRFTHYDEERKINPNLANELTSKDELSGILNFLFKYVQKIKKNGKLSFDETSDDLRQIWAQKADPIGIFLDSCVEQDFESRTSKASIFQAFCKWCKEKKITPKKEKAFNYKVSQKFDIQPTSQRIEGKVTRLWEGIKILSV